MEPIPGTARSRLIQTSAIPSLPSLKCWPVFISFKIVITCCRHAPQKFPWCKAPNVGRSYFGLLKHDRNPSNFSSYPAHVIVGPTSRAWVVPNLNRTLCFTAGTIADGQTMLCSMQCQLPLSFVICCLLRYLMMEVLWHVANVLQSQHQPGDLAASMACTLFV
jgi:hypothetical protein